MQIHPTTESHAIPDGRVRLLGACRSVTGAMTHVEAGGAALLVDCGVAQGDEARCWRFPDAARDVDAVILTHGHNDHVGSLPALLAGGFDKPIFGTAATLEVARLVLEDGLRLQRASDVEVRSFGTRFRALTRRIDHGVETRIPGFSGTIAFREAGHILGSASVEVVTEKSRVILSGDLGRPGTPLLRDPNTAWSTGRPVDLVVMESTYGDGEHRQSHDDVRAALERIVRRAVADGGHILVPAFAIGRVQTLLYHLNALVEAGRLPAIPVAVDSPMGLRVTETYAQNKALFDQEALGRLANGDDPLDFEGLYGVEKARDSIRLRDVKEPMIVIAGSGMCTGGRIVGHLQELLPRSETCVVFVGFQAPGTPGRRIQDAARGGGTVRLDGEEVSVRASIETLNGLSAHADRNELLAWLRSIPDVRRVALHHGEVDAQEAFARWAVARG